MKITPSPSPKTAQLIKRITGNNRPTVECGKKVDPNAPDTRGWKPLDKAIKSNDIKTIRTLLDQGANPNARDPEGFTPLTRAAMEDNIQAIYTLVRHGAKPNAFNKDGSTALLQSLEHPRATAALLDLRADPNLAQKKDPWTPLTWSTHLGYTKSGLLLLNKGANPNALTPQGETPLSMAIGSGNVILLNALLDKGANPYTYDLDGNTMLTRAAIAGGNNPPIMTLVMLNKWVDPNVLNKDGSTTLTKVVNYNALDSLAVLLRSGRVDPNTPDQEGNTPLSIAARNNNTEAFIALYQAGADINAVVNGKAVLKYLPKDTHSGLVDFLGTLIKSEQEAPKE